MGKFLIVFIYFIPLITFADHRKDPSSEKVSKEAIAYIADKKNNANSKELAARMLGELKKTCAGTLYRGCYFWKNKGEIWFQELDSRGMKKRDGIHQLSKWLNSKI